MSNKLLHILDKIGSVAEIIESEIVRSDEEKNIAHNSNTYIELSGRISALAISLDYLNILRDEVSNLLNEFLDECVSTDSGAKIALLEGEIKLLRAQLSLAKNNNKKIEKIKNKKVLDKKEDMN